MAALLVAVIANPAGWDRANGDHLVRAGGALQGCTSSPRTAILIDVDGRFDPYNAGPSELLVLDTGSKSALMITSR